MVSIIENYWDLKRRVTNLFFCNLDAQFEPIFLTVSTPVTFLLKEIYKVSIGSPTTIRHRTINYLGNYPGNSQK